MDATFATAQPNGTVPKFLLQPDGKILIIGHFSQVGTTTRNGIARLNSNGSLDTTFNLPAGANGEIIDFDLQSDGKVVIGGMFTNVGGNPNQIRLGRLNPNGSVDSTFSQMINGTVNAVKVQPDDKILVGGIFNVVSGAVQRIGFARLNADGTNDNAFNTEVPIGVLDIQLQTDNKILISGEFIRVNGFSRVHIARLLNNIVPPKTLFDYDGDAKADISVFRASENRWYILQSSNNSMLQVTFAVAGDVPAPSDYDGDGKTDVAIFRPSTGDWWYLSSINQAQVNVHWGQPGDIPRPSDFDGDGKADFVVYRPTNSVWYILRSGEQNYTILQFGLAEDKPVAVDYDGDGKADVAVWRPSTGTWYLLQTTAGFGAVQWGVATDIPTENTFIP